MKVLSITTLMFVALFSFTLVGGEVTLDQSDVSKISSEAKKQIASEKKEIKKSVQRKSSNKKTDRGRIKNRDKRAIKKESQKQAKQARKEIRKKEIAATKAINESKDKTVTVPKNKLPVQSASAKKKPTSQATKKSPTKSPTKSPEKSSDIKKSTKPVEDESSWYDFAVFWD